MHELGVVFYVVDDVEKVAKDNNVEHINSVTLEIGEVSSVIPECLIDVWNWVVKKHDLLLNAQLKIETIKALTFCENCEQQFETIKFGKTCPHCGSEKTYLLQGREFNIKEIEVY